jgi:hypothetical protein
MGIFTNEVSLLYTLLRKVYSGGGVLIVEHPTRTNNSRLNPMKKIKTLIKIGSAKLGLKQSQIESVNRFVLQNLICLFWNLGANL